MRQYYDFFAGGGMAQAGLGAGWTCLYANDIDERKAECYSRNWGANHLHVGDVRDVTAARLPGNADLAWASFPCQDLSLAGAGRGLKGTRSGTFWAFWELVEALSGQGRAPQVVVLENVCGALTSHGGRDFAAIVGAVADAGYLVGAVVMDAALFVPQSRKRLFIVGVRDTGAIPRRIADPDGPEHRVWHPPAVGRAHAGLSAAARQRWIWWHMPPPTRRVAPLASVIDDDPTGVAWHSPAETSRLVGMMTEVNRRKVEVASAAGTRVVGTIYKRTRPDGRGGRVQRAEVRFDVAGCLRTPNGGSSRQTVIIVKGDSIRTRLLAPREAARLMGLPDSFWLPASYNAAYHVAGDGLVAPVVRHLAAHLLEPLVDAGAAAESAA